MNWKFWKKGRPSEPEMSDIELAILDDFNRNPKLWVIRRGNEPGGYDPVRADRGEVVIISTGVPWVADANARCGPLYFSKGFALRWGRLVHAVLTAEEKRIKEAQLAVIQDRLKKKFLT